MNAPIVLFTYARPDHTRRTVESLQRNHLASSSDLIIFSDAAKTLDKIKLVDEVRSYIDKIDGFNSVVCHCRTSNYGLSKSIIDGVGHVLNNYGRVIVLEDDMVTSHHFLTYMNEALDKYADDSRVISIHGYTYPVTMQLPEAFFLQGADCWGWATWRRGWKLFEADGKQLLEELEQRNLIREFNFNNTYLYSNMLEEQIRGRNDSWAVRWYASAFLAGKLTLYPGRSLVHNIGNDNSGTHCEESTNLNVRLSETPISLSGLSVVPSQEGKQAFEAFFKQQKVAFVKRMVQKAYALLLAKFK